MKVNDMSKNGMASASRQSTDSTAPTGGISNVSQQDNSPVMMNTPDMKPRAFRADQLIEMAADDSYRLATESPRKDKIKG